MKVTEGRGDNIEILEVEVKVVDARGETVARRSLDINEDMWGGGFVQAMQVDADPELEVVAWGAHESNEDRFYFDYEDGAVTVHPFFLASHEARSRAAERHQVQNIDFAGVAVLTFLGVLYFSALGLLWAVLRAVKRAEARRGPPVPEGGTP